MKFSKVTDVTIVQVLADADVKGTFYGPNAEVDALNKAAEILETTGNVPNVYTYRHESLRIDP